MVEHSFWESIYSSLGTELMQHNLNCCISLFHHLLHPFFWMEREEQKMQMIVCQQTFNGQQTMPEVVLLVCFQNGDFLVTAMTTLSLPSHSYSVDGCIHDENDVTGHWMDNYVPASG